MGMPTMPTDTMHPASIAVCPVEATKGAGWCAETCEDRTDATAALRDDAAVLRVIAARLARLLPAGRADVRGDIASLLMVAGDLDGFADSVEDAAA